MLSFKGIPFRELKMFIFEIKKNLVCNAARRMTV